MIDIQEVADTIVSEAHKLGFDPHYVSPFSLNAAANGFNVIGKHGLFVVYVQFCNLSAFSAKTVNILDLDLSCLFCGLLSSELIQNGFSECLELSINSCLVQLAKVSLAVR